MAQSPRDTVAQSPKYTEAQSPIHTVAQSPIHTVAQSPRHTVAQSLRHKVAQLPRYAVAQVLRDRHLLFLGNLLSCPPTSRLCPRLLLVRVVHQRAFRVVHQRAFRVVHQRVFRVGGPNVTAACPYPVLRLDKLYAALIRCLVLWTVTKQIIVFVF